MRHLLGVTLIASALTLSACGGAPPADIRARIEAFEKVANAGRADDLRREYPLAQADWDFYLRGRRQLGRMIRTSGAKAESATWNRISVVTVHHNTEFERGHAVEVFGFRVDQAGTRLESHGLYAGKKMWCPMLSLLASTQCSIEDAPKPTATASR